MSAVLRQGPHAFNEFTYLVRQLTHAALSKPELAHPPTDI